MAEDPNGPILDATEARKRFALYFALKLAGLGALIGGVVLSRNGMTVPIAILLAVGVVALFLRPRVLGLTTRRKR